VSDERRIHVTDYVGTDKSFRGAYSLDRCNVFITVLST
jgi:hypothetical protein